jgi:hypothetical protein
VTCSEDDFAEADPTSAGEAEAKPNDGYGDAPPAADGIFDELTDDQLKRLGVSRRDLSLVRTAIDIESLIGRIPVAVWDDLEAVAGGDDIDGVVERRRLALARFTHVDAQAEAIGWQAEPALSAPTPEVEDLPPVSPPPVVAVFGDRVTSPSTSSRKEPKRAPVPITPPEQLPALPLRDAIVPAETLLAIARTEALAGRVAAAQALHEIVRSRLESEDTVDWGLADVLDLAGVLHPFTLLSHRLERMVEDMREGEPLAPLLSPGHEAAIGRIWTGKDLGPAYSLLVRVPDVLDRRSGVFLSQIIGPAAAESVNERLRIGRPDGGRIRIVEDGTVVSRRDPSSPWFVVGHVSLDEWFPAELVLAA